MGVSGQADGAGIEEEEGTSADRLLLFTDAVVAIAITLLVLPLVDLVPEAATEHAHAREVITDHLDEIGGFLLSFAVIARLWLVHHHLFSGVKSVSRPLLLLNMGWLLFIVLLPFPTEMVGSFGHDRFAGILYYLNVLAAMVCQTGMVLLLRAHPERLVPGSRSARFSDASAATSVTNVAVMLVALAIAAAVPALMYYSLLLLVAVPWVVRSLRGRRGSRD